MKTAIKAVASVELACPVCSQTLWGPGGSAYWTVAELQLADAVLECPHCFSKVKRPKA